MGGRVRCPLRAWPPQEGEGLSVSSHWTLNYPNSCLPSSPGNHCCCYTGTKLVYVLLPVDSFWVPKLLSLSQHRNTCLWNLSAGPQWAEIESMPSACLWLVYTLQPLLCLGAPWPWTQGLWLLVWFSQWETWTPEARACLPWFFWWWLSHADMVQGFRILAMALNL